MNRIAAALSLFVLACVPAERPPPDEGQGGRRTGWAETSPAERAQVRAFARAYVESLRGCATPRRTSETLLGLAGQKGFVELPERIQPRPGARYWTRVGEVDFAAIVLGRRPPTEGVDVVVAEMASPRIDLKPRATYARSGFLLFDTHLVGEVDLRAWLTHPLALYGHVVRAEGDPADIAIGADPADPVFVIPDLLPHLAARAQAERIVDPEGLDAIAASTETGDGTEEERLTRTLLQVLDARYHLGPDAFEHGELTLVPATAPTFLGVDQGLVGAYGQTQAANLFAALHALWGGVPERTSIVVGVEHTGPSAAAPVLPLVVGRVLSAASGESVPERTLRAAMSRSRALAASNVGGVVGQGLAIDARHSDALPGYARQVIDAFDSAGAQIQIVSGGGWGSPSRDLGALELDALDVSIPIAGRASPMQILSTLDLWSAYRADWGFFGMAETD